MLWLMILASAFSNAPKFHRLQFAAICAALMGTIAHPSRPVSASSWRGRRRHFDAVDANRQKATQEQVTKWAFQRDPTQDSLVGWKK